MSEKGRVRRFRASDPATAALGGIQTFDRRGASHAVSLGFGRLQGRDEPAQFFLEALEQAHPGAQQLVHVAIAASGDRLGREASSSGGRVTWSMG